MDTYTIKEVSEMFHLPSSTLRYYEDLGILTNVGRSKSGQRVYIQGHINRLKTPSAALRKPACRLPNCSSFLPAKKTNLLISMRF